MKEHKILADVYADKATGTPRYRIFVDGDMLAERDFVWPDYEIIVRENILVNLEPGEHQLEIIQVNNEGTIEVRNVTVDGISSSMVFNTTE